MTENKRFMVDDCGTLIDITTREHYDYVSDVCPLLNELSDENGELKDRNHTLSRNLIESLEARLQLYKENNQLKQSNQEAIELIYDGILEMHDGKRDYAEKLLNEAIELILND